MTRDKVSILLMSNRIPTMMVVSDTANNIDMILLMCVVLMPFRFAGAPINQIFFVKREQRRLACSAERRVT